MKKKVVSEPTYTLENGILTIDNTQCGEVHSLFNNNSDIVEVIIRGKAMIVKSFNNCPSLKTITIIGATKIHESFNDCPKVASVDIRVKGQSKYTASICYIFESFNHLDELYSLKIRNGAGAIEAIQSFNGRYPKVFVSSLLTKPIYNFGFYNISSKKGDLIDYRINGIQYHRTEMAYPADYAGKRFLVVHGEGSNIVHVVCNSTKDTSKNRGITLDCIEPKYLVLESKGDIITYDKCFEAIDIKYIYLDKNSRITDEFFYVGLAYKEGTVFLLEKGSNTNVFVKWGAKYKFVSGVEEALQIIQEDLKLSLEEEKKALRVIQKAKLIGRNLPYKASYTLNNLAVIDELSNGFEALGAGKLVEPEYELSIDGLGTFKAKSSIAITLQLLDICYRNCKVDRFIEDVEGEEKINDSVIFLKNNTWNYDFLQDEDNSIKIYLGYSATFYAVVEVGNKSLRYVGSKNKELHTALSWLAQPVSFRFSPGDIFPSTYTSCRVCGVPICNNSRMFSSIYEILRLNLFCLCKRIDTKSRVFELALLDKGLGKVLVLQVLGSHTNKEYNLFNRIKKFNRLFSRADVPKKLYYTLEVKEVYKNIPEFEKARPDLAQIVRESL